MKDNAMDINENGFPQRMYHVEWNGVLQVYLRLNIDNFDITDVVPYVGISLLDCFKGEDWKLKDEQSVIDEYNKGKYKWYSILSKECIAKGEYMLSKDDAISLSQERWKIYSPSGKSWDVVSYWDDCDRKTINAEPLEYKEAQELSKKYLDKRRYGSLYHYTVEPHKPKIKKIE